MKKIDEIESLKARYKKEIEKKLNASVESFKEEPIKSKEYNEFRKSFLPKKVNKYESFCNFFGSIVQFKPNPKFEKALLENIKTSHLKVTPGGVLALSYLLPLFLLLFFAVVFVLVPIIIGKEMSFFFFATSMFSALILIIPLQRYPGYLAKGWRQKTANQMVLCVFYLVTYMRQTSNIERAIEFAADHLDPPLSLDLKKILWDVENRVFDTLNDALDDYLKSWKNYSEEFIDAIHLIQSSLFEGEEGKRIGLLDKSLDVILDGTYENMLHYAQNLKNPITTIHMLGVILPILGLVILPLAVSFIEGIAWYHISIVYNFFLTVGVFLLSKGILASRPSGYGDTDISKKKGFKKYRNFIFKIFGFEIRISPLIIASIVGGFFFFMGMIPIILHIGGAQDICWDFHQSPMICASPDPDVCLRTYCAWEYRTTINDLGQEVDTGPFGIIASIMGINFVLALGLGMGVYYRYRSKNVIKIRRETKKLEKEFSTALFQLGNRLGDGLPAEIAFPKVANIMQGTLSGNFFAQVTANMEQLGYGLEKSIFDKKHGAINNYPSKIIESSMKVLVESIKKGPIVAAQAVNNIARYIKEIHRVNERLKDLLADIISSMKQQINFLAPVISAIVVGITSMITFVLGKLKEQSQNFGAGLEGAEGVEALLDLGEGIPTFHFQIIVGIYVVQIAWILTVMANSIENGQDKLGERYLLSVNLIRTTLLYAGLVFIVLTVFQIMAGEIIARTGLT